MFIGLLRLNLLDETCQTEEALNYSIILVTVYMVYICLDSRYVL